MSTLEDHVADLVGEVAEYFDWEGFGDRDEDIEVVESDALPYPYCDVERGAEDAVFRIFVTPHPLDLNLVLPDHFTLFRDLEAEYSESFSDSVLLWRSAEDEEFWYMRRNDEGDIGIFHSDFSLDDEDGEDNGNSES